MSVTHMLMDKGTEHTCKHKDTHSETHTHNTVWGPGRKLTASELTHTLKRLMP